ncbi:MAG TPA: hypothetical protein VEI52_05100 [Terriglobales bacterium]|nr:hypothetical protein [Terriglobales bacterium]
MIFRTVRACRKPARFAPNSLASSRYLYDVLRRWKHGIGSVQLWAGNRALRAKGKPATVQKILPHGDIRTTLKCCVHSDLDVQRHALNKL